MTIPYFADQQNTVFLPALLALLAATLLICLPIVFAPALRQLGRARIRAMTLIIALVAVAALVTAGVQTAEGIRTLTEQRTSAAEQLAARYGLQLGADTVEKLVDGGSPQIALPALAKSLKLKSTADGTHPLKLEHSTSGAVSLTYGGERVPPRA